MHTRQRDSRSAPTANPPAPAALLFSDTTGSASLQRPAQRRGAPGLLSRTMAKPRKAAAFQEG